MAEGFFFFFFFGGGRGGGGGLKLHKIDGRFWTAIRYCYSYPLCQSIQHCCTSKQILQMEHKFVKNPTGRRLTSWLFTKRGGVEFGTTEHKSI